MTSNIVPKSRYKVIVDVRERKNLSIMIDAFIAIAVIYFLIGLLVGFWLRDKFSE